MAQGAAQQDFDQAIARFEAFGLEGRREEQRAELETMFALARATGNRTWYARALIARATLEWMLGEYAQAEALAREAEAVYHEIGDAAGEGVALRRQGDVAAIRGEYVEAGQRYQAALTRFRACGDRQGEVRTLNNLGIVYWGMGDYVSARRQFNQALAIWRDLQDKHGQGIALGNLG